MWQNPLSLAEGVDVTGLMDTPHDDTVKLLISLGAGKTASCSGNVGEYVPGDNRLVLEKQQKKRLKKVNCSRFDLI